MAKGAKKRLEENKKRLQVLLYVIFGSAGFHAVLRFGVFRSSVTWFSYLMFVLTSLIAVIMRSFLSSLAEPSYNSSFEVVDGGVDLSKGGLVSYYKDILYICCATLVLASFSGYFWLILLVIPGAAVYFLLTKFIIPFMQRPSQEDLQSEMMQDEGMRKKMEKAQKRQERRRIKYK
eukprot:TRINITY_DN84040_c0_g1_i6.p2 TRINITY_DN84040_c0_g1~~TRINITY_DN84040_c0_g1_i6.p2  ORF type:complete len:176 (-),score=16.91 TRINITY_DN84040_c0_g1_i6:195-722(-)